MAVSSAQAALNVTERQLNLSDPQIFADAPQDGQYAFYLYNPGTKGFLRGGNNYYTRASVDQGAGYKWRIAIEDADAGLVSLNDSVEYDNSNKACTWGWRKMFATGTDAVYVDNNNGANANTWQIEQVGDGKFRITNTAFVGDDGNPLYLGTVAGTTYCDLYPATTENVSIDWYAVKTGEYDELVKGRQGAIAAFDASEVLLSALKVADEAGVPGLDEYVAVYNNADATADEINAATEAVNKAYISYLAASATPENPIDFTSQKVVNGSFDTVGDFTGWSGDAFSAGGTTGPCAEHYNKNYNTWQEIKDLPNGVYGLDVQGFYRAGGIGDAYTAFKNGDKRHARAFAANVKSGEGAVNDTLYSYMPNIFEGIEAGNSEVSESATTYEGDGNTYYVPNTMKSACDFFDKGYYKANTLIFPVSEGVAKIGVVKTVKEGSTDWSIFDNFKLKYYGNGADAYKMWNADVIKNATEYSEDDQITTSVLEEYNAVKNSAADGSTYEEVMANITNLNAAADAVEANKAAWASYVAEKELAQVVAGNSSYSGPDVEALVDYLELDYADIIGAKALSTEEVINETEKLKTLKEDAVQNSITVGTDMTDLIVNPDFSQGKTGWTFEGTGGSIVADSGAKCAEAWNASNFDIYQTLAGAPVGAYEISVQGFYRRGRGDDAWKLYFDQSSGEKLPTVPETPAYAYCNDMKTPLMNVFEYKVAKEDNYYTGDFYTDAFDYCFPNNMADAGLAFDHDAYTIHTTGLVANKGDLLRIGMKGVTNQEGDSWAIFTRFKLVYKGDDVDILSNGINNAVAEIDLTKNMGKDVKAKAQERINAAKDAQAAGDGKTMRTSLGELLKYESTIEESVSLFTTLETNKEDFYTFIAEVEGYEALKSEAGEYVEGLDLTDMTDEEANAAIAKIASYRHQLSIPEAYKEATDANPVDMTSVISSPSFEKEGVNSIEGWQNTTGYSFGNNDTQKAALAVEFYDKNFDMYQDLEVPNGTYVLTVNAFNRAGSVDADKSAVDAGTDSKALLYAKSGETEVAQPLMHITTMMDDFGAASSQLGAGSESSFTVGENTYYCPNDMVSASSYFDVNRYLNGVTIKVTDGKLRIGIRQEDKVSGSWVIMDNFQLQYFGAASEKEEGGFTDVDAVEAVEVAKIEVYSVDGVKQNSIQKGVNILVITDKAGNVTTKTVIK